MHFIIHGIHHDHPNDKMRLVMPPSVSIPLAALFFARLLADLRQPRRLPALRRLHLRLPRLRLHALLRAPLRAEVEARQATARAAHAPPLPGPPLRLRRLLAALGRGLPDAAAHSGATECGRGTTRAPSHQRPSRSWIVSLASNPDRSSLVWEGARLCHPSPRTSVTLVRPRDGQLATERTVDSAERSAEVCADEGAGAPLPEARATSASPRDVPAARRPQARGTPSLCARRPKRDL